MSRWLIAGSLLTGVLTATAACAGPPEAATPTPVTGDPAPEPVMPRIDSASFGASTRIDNPWLPLKPGTQWVYEGTTTEEGETSDHRIEFTVTDLTKRISGVDTVVALVLDYSDGDVVEKEIAFYAQDDEGGVWYFGEHPEEYEAGEFLAATTWIAGHGDARAGIKMRAQPALDSPSYFQGWAPAVEWSDFGTVEEVGHETCVPVDCYDDVLVIAESSLDEEGAFQLKYYARDVGEVRVGWRGDDSSTEELELIELNRLDPRDLGSLAAEARELDANAYEVSEEVYGHTPPVG